ncbi:hypothetical protein OIV83_005763 [Microbotryomycetes sp. JL201]|nr:hypothetical protein OIV83_005763 [Microbotryomycetes sp. JL201]
MPSVPRRSTSTVSSPVIRTPFLSRRRVLRRDSAGSSWFLSFSSKKQALQAILVLVVLWCEWGTFHSHVRWNCGFNDEPSALGRLWDPSKGDGGQWTVNSTFKDAGMKPFHVLIVSDPQLLDMRSYPGRAKILKWLGMKVTDMYARKSWKFVTNSRGPAGGLDGIVWLGDLLDSGVESVDQAEHSHYVHRFHTTFPLPRQHIAKSIDSSLHPPIPTIYMPGNHDLGLHLESNALMSWARERFQEAFGPTQGQREWGGWDVVWVDSMALLEEGLAGTEAKAWIEKVARRRLTKPRMLLSHIPLFRPEGTPCGSERESGRPLRQGAGKNYQNELDADTTKWLVEKLKPTIVFSGDDHDSCVIRHPYNAPKSSKPVVETTVKAFSMAMGVRRPGYSLVSLYAASDPSVPSTSTYTTTNCVLPDQIGIWLYVYLPLFAFVFGVFILPRLFRKSTDLWTILVDKYGTGRRRLTSARSNGLPVSRFGAGSSINGMTNLGHRPRNSLTKILSAVASPVLPKGMLSSPTAGGRKPDFDDEDLDGQFPTFPYGHSSFHHTNPTGMNGDFASYHAGVGPDDGPTSAHVSSEDDDDDDDDDDVAARRVRTGSFVMGRGSSGLGQVRRVSRVWTWEDRKAHSTNDHGLLIRPDFDGRFDQEVISTSSKRPFYVMHIIVPLTRFVVKPLVRLVRWFWRKLVWVPKLVVEKLSRSTVGGVFVASVSDTYNIVWPAVFAWALLWIWFSVI